MTDSVLSTVASPLSAHEREEDVEVGGGGVDGKRWRDRGMKGADEGVQYPPSSPSDSPLSDWWKGQRVRSHTQISPRTSEEACQLLPIVSLVTETWTDPLRGI